MEKHKIKIGLLGFGNIGVGSYQVLEMNHDRILDTTGLDLEITRILEKNVDRPRPVTVDPRIFTQDPEEIFSDSAISVVVELLGGVHPAADMMLSAMAHGKHVVTANKAAVAACFNELHTAAEENHVMFRYEASVGGGIPVLTALTGALQANRFSEVLGILNGTTNYILTQMTDFGLEYEDVLRVAQEKGFAEADPTADVEGIDAANKLSILISLIFEQRVPPEAIPREGITKVSKRDIEDARKAGQKIKLIACAKLDEFGKLVYSVKPMRISADHPLAGINNEFNAVFITGNAVSDLMFYGKGAGPLPTGSAIMGDVIQIGKDIVKDAAYDVIVPGGMNR